MFGVAGNAGLLQSLGQPMQARVALDLLFREPEETGDADNARRLLPDEPDGQNRRQRECEVEVPALDAGHEEDRHRGREQHHRRAQVAITDQPRQPTHDQRRGQQRISVVDLVFTARDEPRQKHHERRLSQFGGLKLQAPQTIPAVRLRIGEDHADQQDEQQIDGQKDVQRVLQLLVVHAAQREQQQQSNHGRGELLFKKVPGLFGLPRLALFQHARRRARGAEYHHQAESQDHQDGDEHGPVGMNAGRHAR